MEKVVRRIIDEYNDFIEELKKQSAETIISCANEIVVKDNIRMYIENIVDGVYEFDDEATVLLNRKEGNLLSALFALWDSEQIYQEYNQIGDLLYEFAEQCKNEVI